MFSNPSLTFYFKMCISTKTGIGALRIRVTKCETLHIFYIIYNNVFKRHGEQLFKQLK